MAGTRYTNLRDVKHLPRVYFIDIDWKRYDFDRHLGVVRTVRPQLTVARDITSADALDDVIREAELLAKHSESVVLVPKDERLEHLERLGVPQMFRMSYSVPTRYGGTSNSPSKFTGDVHLLGGRPDVQRKLAEQMNVASLDGNRFTLDAQFGDYFDGSKFKPHPIGGYATCLDESLTQITKLWEGYQPGGGRYGETQEQQGRAGAQPSPKYLQYLAISPGIKLGSKIDFGTTHGGRRSWWQLWPFSTAVPKSSKAEAATK